MGGRCGAWRQAGQLWGRGQWELRGLPQEGHVEGRALSREDQLRARGSRLGAGPRAGRVEARAGPCGQAERASSPGPAVPELCDPRKRLHFFEL